MDERTREVERDPHVGELVLDGLEGADRAAVLLALLHVLHRVGQQALARTEQLGGGGEHGQVDGSVVQGVRASHLEQPSGRVDRVQPRPHGTRQQRGHVGVQRVGGQRRYGRRHHRAAGLGSERRGLDPRTHGQLVAEDLEGDDQVHRCPAESVFILGQDERGDALVGQPLPQRDPGLGVPVRPGTGDGDRVCLRHQLGQRLGEPGLLGGEAEVHQARCSRGSPRMRSAITLRWTSLVPA